MLIEIASKLCFLWFPVENFGVSVCCNLQVHVNAVCTPKSGCAHMCTRTHSWVLFSFSCCHYNVGWSLKGVVITPQGLMVSSSTDDLVHHLVDTVKKAQRNGKPHSDWDIWSGEITTVCDFTQLFLFCFVVHFRSFVLLPLFPVKRGFKYIMCQNW